MTTVRDRNVLPATVEINAQNFSYGQFDTGEVGIWAAGESGWFEIKPSRQYRPIYRDMTEAINILYFLADFYWQVKGKRRRTITVDTLLSQVREYDSNKGRRRVLMTRSTPMRQNTTAPTLSTRACSS